MPMLFQSLLRKRIISQTPNYKEVMCCIRQSFLLSGQGVGRMNRTGKVLLDRLLQSRWNDRRRRVTLPLCYRSVCYTHQNQVCASPCIPEYQYHYQNRFWFFHCELCYWKWSGNTKVYQKQDQQKFISKTNFGNCFDIICIGICYLGEF